MIKVVFWDVDGTLTDDQIHKIKHRFLANKAGYEISDLEGMQLNGVNDERTYDYLCNKSEGFVNSYPDKDSYILECRKFFESHAANPDSSSRVRARQGAVDLVCRLSDIGIYQACVTSAPVWQAELNIQALGIAKYMQFTQMLCHGISPKPSPDLYQNAFEVMGNILTDLRKSEVLVIEDSISGVAAGRAAGFEVIHCRMNELAPSSDQTAWHAYDFHQVEKIMAEVFTVPLRHSVSEHKLKNTGGSILNIGSINACCGEDKLLPYAMSKGAMATMTTTLSDALWRDRIRVNQLNLDWVATENEINLKIREGFPPDWYRHVPPYMAPSGELLQPNDIAEIAIGYLSSNKLSGAVVPVGQRPMTVRLNENQSTFFYDISVGRGKITPDSSVPRMQVTEETINIRSRI